MRNLDTPFFLIPRAGVANLMYQRAIFCKEIFNSFMLKVLDVTQIILISQLLGTYYQIKLFRTKQLHCFSHA